MALLDHLFPGRGTKWPCDDLSLYTLHSKRHPCVETTTAPQGPPNLRRALHTDPSHCRSPSRQREYHHGSLQRTRQPFRIPLICVAHSKLTPPTAAAPHAARTTNGRKQETRAGMQGGGCWRCADQLFS